MVSHGASSNRMSSDSALTLLLASSPAAGLSPPFFCFVPEGSGAGLGTGSLLGREEAGVSSGLGVASGVSSS